MVGPVIGCPARDLRIPLTIKPLPGGYAIHFADGRRAMIVYGREEHVARAANSLTLDEAKEVAQDVARALTAAWSRDGLA